MDEIIEKSGIPTSVVYHYYKSIYDIMSDGLDYADETLGNLTKNFDGFVQYPLVGFK